MPLITFTTDFGLTDPFVGILKGVILSLAPHATLVDLCHDIPPQDILTGALTLDAAVDYFPADTIHLAVVDPGVGGARRAIAVQAQRGVFVGPDNGLFTAALLRHPMQAAVALTNPAYHRAPVRPTFHGRDIFAPVAAHLAAGIPLEKFGPPIADLVRLDPPQPVVGDSTLTLHILHIDRFGNLLTDLTRPLLQAWRPGLSEAEMFIEAGNRKGVAIRQTFADVSPGQPVAYLGSTGRLEIAIRNASAAAILNLKIGDTIQLKIKPISSA